MDDLNVPRLELTGATAVLVNGSLLTVTQANDPIDCQTFSVNNNLFR